MAQIADFIPFKTNFSLTLTSSSFKSARTIKDIKFQKSLAQRYFSAKNLNAIQKQYEKIAPNRDIVNKILMVKKNAVQKVNLD